MKYNLTVTLFATQTYEVDDETDEADQIIEAAEQDPGTFVREARVVEVRKTGWVGSDPND